MCFSAPVSFATGLGLLGLGAITLRCVGSRKDWLYACIPLLFGTQQLLEGMLWLALPDHAGLLSTSLTYLYLLFSNVLWPIYVPLATWSLEPVRWRRQVILTTAGLGGAVGLYLLAILFLRPVTAHIDGRHILYDFSNPYEQLTILSYVAATCLSLLFSSQRRVVAFGLAAFVSEVAAYTFYKTWFISVWCFFAAILSAIVLWHFVDRRSSSPTA